MTMKEVSKCLNLRLVNKFFSLFALCTEVAAILYKIDGKGNDFFSIIPEVKEHLSLSRISYSSTIVKKSIPII